MSWIRELFLGDSIAQTVLIYGLVIAIGIWIGRLKIFGVSLGVTWILFIGLLFSFLGLHVNDHFLHFLKEFGLILFVYTIGLQVGPGFFASLRQSALLNNLLTIAIVLMGVGITLIFYYFSDFSITTLTGVMSGAVTNTPGMGAAQSTAIDLKLNTKNINFIPLAYAIVYPFGVFGIILSMLILKKILRVNLEKERELHRKLDFIQKKRPVSIHLNLQNRQLIGKTFRELTQLFNEPFVVSRMLNKGQIITPTPDTILEENDVFLIVAHKHQVPKLKMIIGNESSTNLKVAPRSELISRIIVVTNKEATHKKISEIFSLQQHNFTLSRVARAGVELIPHGNMILQMSDQVKVVGSRNGVEIATRALGNEMRRLDVPDIAPIFVGIVLGVLLGSIPIYILNLSIPIRIGLAAGPLIIALILSRYGNKIYLNQFTTYSANLMLRELGISLFLASVGLGSGKFLQMAFADNSVIYWLLMGLSITIIPLVTVGLIAYYKGRKTYLEICGLLAGASTDPPALAFANEMAANEVASINYASVYPVAMILRIIVAQLLIIFLAA